MLKQLFSNMMAYRLMGDLCLYRGLTLLPLHNSKYLLEGVVCDKFKGSESSVPVVVVEVDSEEVGVDVVEVAVVEQGKEGQLKPPQQKNWMLNWTHMSVKTRNNLF
jgi:hypothetical protein